MDETLQGQLAARGYVVVENLIGSDLLDRTLDAISRRLRSFAQEPVPSRSRRRPLEAAELSEQIIGLVRRSAVDVPRILDISLPQSGIRHDTPIFLAEEVFALLSAPPILDLLTELLGGVVWLNPVGHTRTKVPTNISLCPVGPVHCLGFDQ